MMKTPLRGNALLILNVHLEHDTQNFTKNLSDSLWTFFKMSLTLVIDRFCRKGGWHKWSTIQSPPLESILNMAHF